jgi:hypothetical protein
MRFDLNQDKTEQIWRFKLTRKIPVEFSARFKTGRP